MDQDVSIMVASSYAAKQGFANLAHPPWGAPTSMLAYMHLLHCITSSLVRPVAEGCLPWQLGGVSALEISGNFMFDPITHRDVLGACCTGTGVVRGKIGDILVHGEQGAQMLVAPDLVEHFQMFLTQVQHSSQALMSSHHPQPPPPPLPP